MATKAMKTIVTVTPMKDGADVIPPGTEVEVSATDAAALVACGAAAWPKPAKQKPAEK